MQNRSRALPLLLAVMGGAALGQQRKGSSAPEQLITYCLDYASSINLPDEPTEVTDVVTERGYSLRGNGAGQFQVRREGKVLYSFHLRDYFNPNMTVVWAPEGKAFAITYSDGGAIGGFHVRAFTVVEDKVTDVTKAIEPAVAEFKSRHRCKTRGNNVQALKWIGGFGKLLIMTDVYPTSDCGPELGHTEGYVVSVPEGTILKHLTLTQLRLYPGVCLRNADGS